MKFEVTKAVNVRCYNKIVVDAPSLEEAIAKAQAIEGQCEYDSYEYGEEADAAEPSYWATECDQETGEVFENGETCDERDDSGYVYKTDLERFAKMLAEAVAEHSGLVNDDTGALMTPADIRKAARHILKLDGSGA